MRYLLPKLQKDLKKKMVIMAGPRQCGKTTLAKSLLDKDGEYLNWDIVKDRKIIRDIAWPKDASLVVLDELHKAPKWKNLLKGVADEFGNKPPVLVTGSARLDSFRRTGDALTGRHYFYRLHPIDVAESKRFLPKVDLDGRIRRLLQTGGFPEAFLNPGEAARLLNDRLELVVKEDSRDLSRIRFLARCCRPGGIAARMRGETGKVRQSCPGFKDFSSYGQKLDYSVGETLGIYGAKSARVSR